MSVLVIGAAGFVGSHLVDRLVASHAQVVAVDDLANGRLANLQRALSSHRATFVYGNSGATPDTLSSLVSRAANGRLTAIYHLSAVPRDSAWPTNEAAFDVTTLAAIELALEHGARLVVGSPAGTAGRRLEGPFVERRATSFPEPAIALAMRDRGLSASCVRYFDAYGPRAEAEGESLLAPMLDAVLRYGPLPVPGDGMQPTAMTFVADIVEGLIRAGTSPEPLERVDLAGSEEMSIASVARRVAAFFDVPFRGDPRPASADRRSRPRPDRRAAATLGWVSSIPLAAGLRATHAWLRAERKAYVAT